MAAIFGMGGAMKPWGFDEPWRRRAGTGTSVPTRKSLPISSVGSGKATFGQLELGIDL